MGAAPKFGVTVTARTRVITRRKLGHRTGDEEGEGFGQVDPHRTAAGDDGHIAARSVGLNRAKQRVTFDQPKDVLRIDPVGYGHRDDAVIGAATGNRLEHLHLRGATCARPPQAAIRKRASANQDRARSGCRRGLPPWTVCSPVCVHPRNGEYGKIATGVPRSSLKAAQGTWLPFTGQARMPMVNSWVLDAVGLAGDVPVVRIPDVDVLHQAQGKQCRQRGLVAVSDAHPNDLIVVEQGLHVDGHGGSSGKAEGAGWVKLHGPSKRMRDPP